MTTKKILQSFLISKYDFLRFQQVLLNILANAVKFTLHGYIFVKVMRAVDRRQPNIDLIVLFVEDSGIGKRKISKCSFYMNDILNFFLNDRNVPCSM